MTNIGLICYNANFSYFKIMIIND